MGSEGRDDGDGGGGRIYVVKVARWSGDCRVSVLHHKEDF
jgi:hypothetical protein